MGQPPSTQPTFWRERVVPLFRDPPMVAEARARINYTRLHKLAPLLVVVHAVHVAVFALFPRHDPIEQQWAHRILLTHAITGGLLLLIWLLGGFAFRGEPHETRLPTLLGLLYLLHGAALAGFDQAITARLTPFLSAAFGIGLILRLRRGPASIIYAIGTLVFCVLQAMLQRDSAIALSNQVNGFAVAAVGLAAAWASDASFRRERMMEDLLSICSYCHSIRNPEGGWERLETYVGSRAEVTFSHGVCETCYRKNFAPPA